MGTPQGIGQRDGQPKRIVNLYNFVRAFEPRDRQITPEVLIETTATQLRLIGEYGLPSTTALQYDALMDGRYQRLLLENAPPGHEVAAWWEIVQPLAEKAGIPWRGRFAWDWHAHVGFSVGYTPAEREALVDVYMADFKAVFGSYPLTVGSWFIDAHSLAYMADAYGVIASCNCKDQVGTDGYTLWGGYWNQAYYPSRKNAYLPAQEAAAQIPIPIFRMLGSDPIYQYDDCLGSGRQAVISLEPVYGNSGANPSWVRWFLGVLAHEPCLAFAYAQAGQENSFTWAQMRDGYTCQIPMIASLAHAGEITVETLADSGRWFRSRFPLTPATAVTALTDWQGLDHKTVWYNSRFYRANLLWKGSDFRFRDLHLFDQDYASEYLTRPLTESACRYDALPVLDGFHWSTRDCQAGLRLIQRTAEGERVLRVAPPEVAEEGPSTLVVASPVEGLGMLCIRFMEDRFEVRLEHDGQAVPDWALQLSWHDTATAPFRRVTPTRIDCQHRGFSYGVACMKGHFERKHDARTIEVLPDAGAIVLDMTNSRQVTAGKR